MFTKYKEQDPHNLDVYIVVFYGRKIVWNIVHKDI